MNIPFNREFKFYTEQSGGLFSVAIRRWTANEAAFVTEAKHLESVLHFICTQFNSCMNSIGGRKSKQRRHDNGFRLAQQVTWYYVSALPTKHKASQEQLIMQWPYANKSYRVHEGISGAVWVRRITWTGNRTMNASKLRLIKFSKSILPALLQFQTSCLIKTMQAVSWQFPGSEAKNIPGRTPCAYHHYQWAAQSC